MTRLALITLAALLLPAVAAAKPPPVSAVSQYVETIPTASGPSHPGTRSEAASSIPLAPRAEQALAEQPAEQAKELEEVATSPRYGAPETRLPKPDEAAPLAAGEPADGRLPSAGDLASSAGGEALWLIVLLGGTALAIGAWAFVRR